LRRKFIVSSCSAHRFGFRRDFFGALPDLFARFAGLGAVRWTSSTCEPIGRSASSIGFGASASAFKGKTSAPNSTTSP
jgi:hypothetical protein